MNEVEVAWAAGFFEGEGTIALPSLQHALVRVVQKSKEPLAKLQELFGGVVGVEKHSERPYYRWQLNTRKALPFLEAIAPYIVTELRRKEIAAYLSLFTLDNEEDRLELLIWFRRRKT